MQGLSVAGDVGRFAGVLHFRDIPPGIGAGAIEVGEAIDLGQPAARKRDRDEQ